MLSFHQISSYAVPYKIWDDKEKVTEFIKNYCPAALPKGERSRRKEKKIPGEDKRTLKKLCKQGLLRLNSPYFAFSFPSLHHEMHEG